MRHELLHLDRIYQESQGIVVLNHLSLYLFKGETVHILGPSGCGKSSLAKMIAGASTPDHGKYLWKRTHRSFRSVREANKEGIFLVGKHPCCAGNLTVAENLVLMKKSTCTSPRYRQEIFAAAQAVCQDMGFDVDITLPASRLSENDRILLEIYRAAFLKARLLILDEVLSRLSKSQLQHLQKKIQLWKAKGMSILILDIALHRSFPEADRYLFMRNGTIALEYDHDEYRAGLDTTILRKWANAEQAIAPQASTAPFSNNEVFRMTFPTAANSSYTLSAYSGEVVGLVRSNRNTSLELKQLLESGHADISLFGRFFSPKRDGDLFHFGIGFIDRASLFGGVYDNLTVLENFELPSMVRHREHILHRSGFSKFLFNEFSPQMSLSSEDWLNPTGYLKKDERQQVALYRLLACGLKALVIESPFEKNNHTSNLTIMRFIQTAAHRGTAVLLTCDDRDLLQSVCNRIVEVLI